MSLIVYQPPVAIAEAWRARGYTSLQIEAHVEAMERRFRLTPRPPKPLPRIVWEMPPRRRKPLELKPPVAKKLAGNAGEFYAPAKMCAAQIISEVALDHGLFPIELKMASRRAERVAARAEAMYRLRLELGLSLPVIGLHLGGRDHTTICYGISKYCDLTGADLPAGMRKFARSSARRAMAAAAISAIEAGIMGGTE